MTKRPVCICTCIYCKHAKYECAKEPSTILADSVIDPRTGGLMEGKFGYCDDCRIVSAAHPDESP